MWEAEQGQIAGRRDKGLPKRGSFIVVTTQFHTNSDKEGAKNKGTNN